MDENQLKRRFYPEANISGLSHVDGTVTFYSHLAAIVRPEDVILDFGAGRGEPLVDDDIAYRRDIGNFKGRCAHLDGCDVDPVVLENPFLDQATVIREGERLPYEDNRFDIVFARSVFEHIIDPDFVARELLRIVKPHGIIAATTPNKWGYIAVSARMVPNKFHVKVLSRSQPDRKPEDVFPTQYKMNTRRDLQRVFRDGDRADVFVTRKAPEPAYHFGRPWLYRFFKFMNKHSPDNVQPILDVYVRKR
ncbi:class I SAM-dependent methyltransferase [Mycobacterium sp. NPDC003323]